MNEERPDVEITNNNLERTILASERAGRGRAVDRHRIRRAVVVVAVSRRVRQCYSSGVRSVTARLQFLGGGESCMVGRVL